MPGPSRQSGSFRTICTPSEALSMPPDDCFGLHDTGRFSLLTRPEMGNGGPALAGIGLSRRAKTQSLTSPGLTTRPDKPRPVDGRWLSQLSWALIGLGIPQHVNRSGSRTRIRPHLPRQTERARRRS